MPAATKASGFRPTLSRLRRRLRIAVARIRLALSKKTLSIKLRRDDVGFFAQMNGCVRLIGYARENNLDISLQFSSDNYLDPASGGNWLTQYFTAKPDSGFSLSANNPIYIKEIDELGIRFDSDPTMTQANAIIEDHMAVRPEIMAVVDDFCQSNGIDGTSLGVHYRGTDKSTEAPRVNVDWALGAINAFLAEHPTVKTVFVASDEQAFIDKAIAGIVGARVAALDDHKRSTDGNPVHLGNKTSNKHHLGLDALVNCLVLARCGTLMRSSSFLSAWASIFNPEIKVILFNRPFEATTWYPEREIMKTATVLDNPN